MADRRRAKEEGAVRAKASVIAVVLSASVLLPGAASGDTSALSHGVTEREIRIGLHMPMTGAAPIPSDSAQKGADVYWKWLRQRNVKINGRYVEPIVKNDNYNPSQAVAVCKEMVEQDHVFLLSGTMQPGGANQVQACARYAASVNVPYVSFGSTKVGLTNLKRYFAISKTWPGQAKMLADLLVSDLGARRERNGMVRQDNPNNEDTHDAFVRAMADRGAALRYDRAVGNAAGQTEAEVVVQEMKAAGVENVFILSTPVWFLQVLQAARTHDYHPTWVGIQGMPLSGDGLASIACRNGDPTPAWFLSPLPAYANRDSFDPRHDRAMQKVYGERGDAITWLGWAGSKAIRKMLERGGRDLTRRRFVRRVERTGTFRTGILPPFGFTATDHFGGRAIHVLKIDCSQRRWKTVRRFVRDF
ncbi:MAG: ABC transporter substrate-binding protein [Actinobacteria bacterium]|nr:ABC transporter substrate-binding protein [Actinomycetota bacterium]